jgi:hypothetical protein
MCGAASTEADQASNKHCRLKRLRGGGVVVEASCLPLLCTSYLKERARARSLVLHRLLPLPVEQR